MVVLNKIVSWPENFLVIRIIILQLIIDEVIIKILLYLRSEIRACESETGLAEFDMIFNSCRVVMCSNFGWDSGGDGYALINLVNSKIRLILFPE